MEKIVCVASKDQHTCSYSNAETYKIQLFSLCCYNTFKHRTFQTIRCLGGDFQIIPGKNKQFPQQHRGTGLRIHDRGGENEIILITNTLVKAVWFGLSKTYLICNLHFLLFP